MKFGYYPEPLDVTIGDISISTLPKLNETIESEKAKAKNDWSYSCNDNRRFRLPNTHSIKHAKIEDKPLLDFLVCTFGFFVGMEMSHKDFWLRDCARIKPAPPFLCSGDHLNNLFLYSELFWKKHKDDDLIVQAMKNIIMSLFNSERCGAYEHEIFRDLYSAFEGIYFVYCKKGKFKPREIGHADRIQHVCDCLGVNISPWIKRDALKNIIKIRNETAHDGLFFGKPFGFSFFGNPENSQDPGANTLLEMKSVVTKLIVALLDIPAKECLSTFDPNRTECLDIPNPNISLCAKGFQTPLQRLCKNLRIVQGINVRNG